ncbi:hypothetical protein, partial [Sphingobium yanoikuyae]|uniref:hypothetical protein n=1 Tax=Sphingobium yanoikuyae TaxID=13690 RepID=UPI0035C87314
VALPFVPQPVIVPDRLFQIQYVCLAHVHRLLSLRIVRMVASLGRTAMIAPVFGKGGIYLFLLRRL